MVDEVMGLILNAHEVGFAQDILAELLGLLRRVVVLRSPGGIHDVLLIATGAILEERLARSVSHDTLQ